MTTTRLLIGALAVLTLSQSAYAQVIGMFSWQTQPYCNVVTVTVVQQAGVYQLFGSDNLCGTGTALVEGVARPSGANVEMAFTVHQARRAVSVTATITLATLAGSWSDERRSGTIAFGANAAGQVRPTGDVAVTGGNGEGVGGNTCIGNTGVEVFIRDPYGNLVDHRFSFIIPGFAHGQIRSDGSIRTGTAKSHFSATSDGRQLLFGVYRSPGWCAGGVDHRDGTRRKVRRVPAAGSVPVQPRPASVLPKDGGTCV